MYKDLNCPYCDHAQNVNHDDGFGYDESKNHEMECEECEKIFTFTTCISIDYSPSKADCLNGEDHNLKPTCTVPRKYTKMSCCDCDFTRPCTAEEMSEVMKKYS